MQDETVTLPKTEYAIIQRIIKQARALEACVSRSAINPNHPKFLLAKALKDLGEYKQCS